MAARTELPGLSSSKSCRGTGAVSIPTDVTPADLGSDKMKSIRPDLVSHKNCYPSMSAASTRKGHGLVGGHLGTEDTENT